MSFYASPATRRQATLAVRVGGAHNVGTFPFYAANMLGGTTNLRGYRGSRFSGRSNFFTNSEVRVGLLDIGGEVLPGTLGALGFFDIGRVWTDGESSSEWHAGYGGGLWYNVVGEVLIRFTVGLSPEDMTYLGGAGFLVSRGALGPGGAWGVARVPGGLDESRSLEPSRPAWRPRPCAHWPASPARTSPSSACPSCAPRPAGHHSSHAPRSACERTQTPRPARIGEPSRPALPTVGPDDLPGPVSQWCRRGSGPA